MIVLLLKEVQEPGNLPEMAFDDLSSIIGEFFNILGQSGMYGKADERFTTVIGCREVVVRTNVLFSKGRGVEGNVVKRGFNSVVLEGRKDLVALLGRLDAEEKDVVVGLALRRNFGEGEFPFFGKGGKSIVIGGPDRFSFGLDSFPSPELTLTD
jgi:hypothetical protein